MSPSEPWEMEVLAVEANQKQAGVRAVLGRVSLRNSEMAAHRS